MRYDPTRLGSYVRFYTMVVRQLTSAWENIARTHLIVNKALAPFGETLGPVASSVLVQALGEPPAYQEALGALFRPADDEGLTGLTDLYEVVGRFSFQGENNENLARVQALVSGARNEIVAQRMRLMDLAKLPEVARAVAARLASEEVTRAEAERRSKAAMFEPLAEQVQVRARQTMDAVRAVALPDLTSADSAADDYRRYTTRLEQVYQTCLPFLRKAIASLYASVGAEPTASWPDTLPLVRDLPAELVSVPPEGSPELSQARAGLAALADEDLQLARARDEIATAMARCEGESAAASLRDKEVEVELGVAGQIVDHVAAMDAAQASRQTLATLEQQKTERLRSTGAVWQRHTSIEAGIRLLDEELNARTEEIAQADAALAAERKAEPVLFGKDDWRLRVVELEGNLEALRAAVAQRMSMLKGLKMDLSAVGVEVQTEQQQGLFIDRQIADTRAALASIQATLGTLSTALGASRLARPMTLDEAHGAVAALQQARNENSQRMERLRFEMRRLKEETVRVLSRLKQIGVERQQMEAMVKSVEMAATQGREEALGHLAAQRRAAVERHVGEVLGTLEKSLAMVVPVFVDPARKVMMDATEPRPEVSSRVREGAENLVPVLEKLGRELDAELLAQDAALGQIQREFCDVAAAACKAAWS